MALGYNPKASTAVPQYVVNKAGDPWFIPGNEQRTPVENDADWFQIMSLACQVLSPKGEEKVAS